MKITGFLLKPMLAITMGVTSLSAPSIASAANMCGGDCTVEKTTKTFPDGSKEVKEKMTCTVELAGCL